MIDNYRKRGSPFVLILASVFCSAAGCVSTDEIEGKTNAISNGPQPPDVASRPYLDGVVQLMSNGEFSCSGVLITPRLVLTASHCFGFDSATDPTAVGTRGGDTSCTIEDRDGNVIAAGMGCGEVSVTHLDGNPTMTANIKHVWVAGLAHPKGSLTGRDMAIAVLDRRATPLTAAAPSVPVWFEGDPGADHWKNASIVYAGWGVTDSIADTCAGPKSASRAATALSVEWRKTLDGDYPVDSNHVAGNVGTPMFVANFDLYGDSTGLTLPGDSGGPLFSPDSSGVMRVVGVTSGTACVDYEVSGTIQSLWARTFNDEQASLLRRIVMGQDGRSRGNDIVPGQHADMDSDGVTETAMADPNPWIPEQDNCIDVANPDQLDDDKDGIGNLCEDCPGAICTPPPPAPTNCHATSVSCVRADVQCDPLPPDTVISVDGFLIEVVDAANGRLNVSYAASGETTVDWSVCARNIGGQSCSTSFPVTLRAPCSTGWVPEEYRCPWGQVRCGGSCRPIYLCNFLE